MRITSVESLKVRIHCDACDAGSLPTMQLINSCNRITVIVIAIEIIWTAIEEQVDVLHLRREAKLCTSLRYSHVHRAKCADPIWPVYSAVISIEDGTGEACVYVDGKELVIKLVRSHWESLVYSEAYKHLHPQLGQQRARLRRVASRGTASSIAIDSCH